MQAEEYQNKPQLYVVMEQEILCRKDLSITAKLVYARMSGFKEFWESPEKTGLFLGKSAKTIIGARQELEKKGLIKCIRNTGRGKAYSVVRLTETKQADYSKSGSQTTQNLAVYIKEENKTENKDILDIYKEEVPKHVSVEAEGLANELRHGILANYPNNATAKKDSCISRWAVDIDKMIRLDGRKPEQIRKAIIWAMNDDFWQCNIWSGKALRKHYDRLEANAKAKFMKHGSVTI